MKNILFAIWLSLFGMACGAQSASGGRVLSPDAFESRLRLSGIQLVDVRTPEEFAGGHLEGAVNIDIKSPDFSSRIASELDKDQPVYVYCRSGGRSASAGDYLAAQGYSEIYDLKGGILSWMDSGKKVVR